MASVKQVHIDGMTIDKGTGAVLSPRPKGRLRETEVSIEPVTGSRAVEWRASRGRGMYAQKRWIRVTGSKSNVHFHVQTTEEFGNHEVPDANGGYKGRVQLDEYERIVGGRCSCPDWQKGAAKLPNGIVFCKHMGLARRRALRDGLDEPELIILELGYDNGEVLERVKRNGRFREPKTRDPNVAREWLVKQGYDLFATEPRPDGLVRMMYVRR